MTRCLTIFLLLTVAGCNRKDGANNLPDRVTDTIKAQQTFVPADTIPKENYTDASGRKQGIWKTYLNKKVWKIFTYRNDTLNGYSRENLEDPACYHEEYYANGKPDGISRTYNKGGVQFMRYYSKGERMWWVSPAVEKDFLIPLKGFMVKEGDTVYVKAPFLNGQIWYEGLFVSTKKFKNNNFTIYRTIMLGLHKIYFDNGTLRGLVDYDKKTISEFDKSGKQIYSTVFNDFRKHRQDIESIYTDN